MSLRQQISTDQKNIKTEKLKSGLLCLLYSYRQRVRVITLFPNIFFVLSLHVERGKSDAYKLAHWHNAACALSSPSRWF